jgi:hypothetical protein
LIFVSPGGKVAYGGRATGQPNHKEIQVISTHIAIPACVLALCAALAPSANALLPAEWLLNGAPVTSATGAVGTGEAFMEETGAKLGMVCSGIGVGTVGSGGTGETTETLTLSSVTVSLTAPALCKARGGCEENSTDVESAPEKLPWKGLVLRDESGKFFLVAEGETTYYVSCLILGIKTSEECTTNKVSFEIKNVIGGVEEVGFGTPNATCTLGGTEAARLEALPGNLLTIPGGTVSVSP